MAGTEYERATIRRLPSTNEIEDVEARRRFAWRVVDKVGDCTR